MDRLAMMLTGQTTIQEVLLFPQMRPEKKQTKAEDNEAAVAAADENAAQA